MSTSWSSASTDARPVAEVVNLNGKHVYKVTQHGFLLGKGYYATTEEVETALINAGLSMAALVIKTRRAS